MASVHFSPKVHSIETPVHLICQETNTELIRFEDGLKGKPTINPDFSHIFDYYVKSGIRVKEMKDEMSNDLKNLLGMRVRPDDGPVFGEAFFFFFTVGNYYGLLPAEKQYEWIVL